MYGAQSPRNRGRLPVETTSFVGREAELARLSALLRHARLVTVTGPAGVGKTRLAPRAAAPAARRFARRGRPPRPRGGCPARAARARGGGRARRWRAGRRLPARRGTRPPGRPA